MLSEHFIKYSGVWQPTQLAISRIAKSVCGLVLLDALRDEGGRIVDFKYNNVNASLRGMIGMDRRELLGQTVKRLFPDIRLTSGNMKNSDLIKVNTKALRISKSEQSPAKPLRCLAGLSGRHPVKNYREAVLFFRVASV